MKIDIETREMKRRFIETPRFRKDAESIGINDAILAQLQIDIMNGGGTTISETGGFKKIRIPLPGRGKSGGARVVYADYPDLSVVLLFVAFPKNVRGNLSRKERHALRKIKAGIDESIRSA